MDLSALDSETFQCEPVLAQFFKRTVIGAAAVTLIVGGIDRALAHDPPWVLPFDEPWVSIVGAVCMWLGLVAISHVARWLYLAISGREPNLGD